VSAFLTLSYDMRLNSCHRSGTCLGEPWPRVYYGGDPPRRLAEDRNVAYCLYCRWPGRTLEGSLLQKTESCSLSRPVLFVRHTKVKQSAGEPQIVYSHGSYQSEEYNKTWLDVSLIQTWTRRLHERLRERFNANSLMRDKLMQSLFAFDDQRQPLRFVTPLEVNAKHRG